MLVLIVMLLAIIILLALNDVRILMYDNERLDLGNERQGDGSFHGSANSDEIIPNPLPRELRDQGIDWNSDTLEPPTPGV